MIVFTIGVISAVFVYQNQTHESVTLLSNYLVTFTSFFISLIALVIAMVTYFSIDSVNNITAMDGNVLENSNYSIAYAEMVNGFSSCKDQKTFMNKLLESIELPVKTETCICYADRLQKIIDNLIWFAYVDFSDQEFIKRRDALVQKIEKECKRYNTLSNGVQYLLDENVKLIEYVLSYQQSRQTNRCQIASMENIRGKMIANPISQIVYFDYLGLDYRKKASAILNKCGDEHKEFSKEHMLAIKNFQYSGADRQHFFTLIRRAKKSFENAHMLSDENVLWEGYILYNEVRTDIMCFLMGDEKKDIIIDNLTKVIETREDVEYLFYEKDAYLSQMFAKETEIATNLKNEFMQAFN